MQETVDGEKGEKSKGKAKGKRKGAKGKGENSGRGPAVARGDGFDF